MSANGSDMATEDQKMQHRTEIWNVPSTATTNSHDDYMTKFARPVVLTTLSLLRLLLSKPSNDRLAVASIL
jgi:hypothetical protein